MPPHDSRDCNTCLSPCLSGKAYNFVGGCGVMHRWKASCSSKKTFHAQTRSPYDRLRWKLAIEDFSFSVQPILLRMAVATAPLKVQLIGPAADTGMEIFECRFLSSGRSDLRQRVILVGDDDPRFFLVFPLIRRWLHGCPPWLRDGRVQAPAVAWHLSN